MMYGHEILNR